MIRTALAFTAVSALFSCTGDETLSGYGAAGVTWSLVELDGAPFEAPATLQFPEENQLSGKAPCNSYSGTQTAPYPWFAAGPLAVTRRACPQLDAEAAYFEALGAMSLAEVSGDVLILSNDEGRSMIFHATDPAE